MDYSIKPAARCCCQTGRAFQPGETFYSALFFDEKQVSLIRRDYSREAWHGRPKDSYACWRCEIPPLEEEVGSKPATNEQLLEFFDKLRDDPTQTDMLFVMTLLLIRRRLFKEDDSLDFSDDLDQSDFMKVYCPRRNESYTIEIVDIPLPRQDEIQAVLERLVFGEQRSL
ncbi:MAG: hypothetical protein IJQ39_12535 [Thermoguttaceae bacterium]|nr:hypothetical protein [Thermoguttaceae bacterium]